MFGLSLGEVILLGIIALIVIGPEDLPKMARTIGRFINELKRTTGDLTSDLREQAKFDPIRFLEDQPKPKAPAKSETVADANATPPNQEDIVQAAAEKKLAQTESDKKDNSPT